MASCTANDRELTTIGTGCATMSEEEISSPSVSMPSPFQVGILAELALTSIKLLD